MITELWHPPLNPINVLFCIDTTFSNPQWMNAIRAYLQVFRETVLTAKKMLEPQVGHPITVRMAVVSFTEDSLFEIPWGTIGEPEPQEQRIGSHHDLSDAILYSTAELDNQPWGIGDPQKALVVLWGGRDGDAGATDLASRGFNTWDLWLRMRTRGFVFEDGSAELLQDILPDHDCVREFYSKDASLDPADCKFFSTLAWDLFQIGEIIGSDSAIPSYERTRYGDALYEEALKRHGAYEENKELVKKVYRENDLPAELHITLPDIGASDDHIKAFNAEDFLD